MLKVLNRLAWIVVAVAVLAGISYWTYRYTENQRLIRKLEEEKAQLQQIVQRLTSQKRVAEMMPEAHVELCAEAVPLDASPYSLPASERRAREPGRGRRPRAGAASRDD